MGGFEFKISLRFGAWDLVSSDNFRREPQEGKIIVLDALPGWF
jgi:hypothetical protein